MTQPNCELCGDEEPEPATLDFQGQNEKGTEKSDRMHVCEKHGREAESYLRRQGWEQVKRFPLREITARKAS